MSSASKLLDPVEFLQPGRRLFIDTNIFMDADERRAGGLKRLFERGRDAILINDNPIVVPTKVVDELTRQSRLRGPAEGEERAASIKKAGTSLAFLESASAAGLIRKDLGHNTNPYADDLFLELFERFAGTYEMCLLTRDLTILVRVRLLAHRLGRRLVAGELTKDGRIKIESDQTLLERGWRKYAKLEARAAGGNGKPKDKSEIADLKPALDEFATAFGLKAPDPAAAARAANHSTPARRSAGTAKRPAFAGKSGTRAPDAPLPFTALPQQGDTVTWEAAGTSGTLVLGKLLGEGGEGCVYEGGRKTVVKIFDKDHITRHRKEKIELLVGRSLEADGVCIPSALVRNRSGDFVGYVMPKASGREFQRTIFNRRKFEKEFPNWKKADLVDICISFLEKVQFLHSMNVILGDINPKNLMVDDKKNVFIIDADSWQVEGYPCPVGTPMFTSPAMLGKTYSDDLRTMDDELFAVATMLFMIVMTGQFPYIRTGTDGDMVQLIKEGNFAFQYENRNNKDQPDGDWKYMWSHIHKPVKDLFWHTFHKEGRRYSNRPSAAEWLAAFNAYKAYLGDKRENFDPMSNDVYPIRPKAFKPDTPIKNCPGCGRKNAIAGIWKDHEQEYFVPAFCMKCKDAQPHRTAAARPAAPITHPCKDCGKTSPRTSLTYGRCPTCTTRAKSFDTNRLCTDCRQPFITHDHIGWFTSRHLDIPKSHSAIKQTCPTARTARPTSPARPGPQTKPGFWARVKDWFGI